VMPSANTTYRVTVTGTNGCTATDAVVVSINKTKPTANAGPDVAVTCTTPSTVLKASGGIAYIWSNGTTADTTTVMPSANTTYRVTVTGTNGCTAIDSVTVTSSKIMPAVHLSSDGQLTCYKTSVTLTANGGDSYAWPGGGIITTKVVTTPGIYTVTVTSANGCSATSSMTVSEDNTRPTIITTNDGPLTCTKTSVTLTATGDGSYAWSGSGTAATKVVTTPGTYTVTVTSTNGCTNTSTTTVSQDETIPIINATNDGPLSCIKTSVTLTTAGGGSYIWSDGAIVSSPVVTTAGTYTVTVTGNNGCQNTASTIVSTDYTTPSVSVTNDGPVSCMKTSVTLTATGGDSYAWAGGGVAPTKVVTTPGNYTVTVTGYNGCTVSIRRTT
jgi:hypothetical protein